MDKEQRKLLLIVQLGGAIPEKLFRKYNSCDECSMECHRDKNFRSIVMVRLDDGGLAGFCSHWTKKNEV